VHGPVTPKQVEDLARIRRNKDLLLAIINDILQFTREDSHELAMKSEPVELPPLLTEVTDVLGAQIRARELRFVVGSVPADAIPRGDRAKVEQVLLNVLSNAIKFTDKGGEITVDTTTTDGEVRIAVCDTGIGIEASELESIFEPFTQLDTSLSRRAPGTGLGLSIARKFATAMGGTVAVRSQPGVGSTFTVTLPRADAPDPARTRPPRQAGERQPA
jgi:signal transduction histidine kinase